MNKFSKFVVPDKVAREAALGSFTASSHEAKSIFTSLLPLFEPISNPGPSDWLSCHSEKGQDYSDFLHSPKNLLDNKRNIIYIQPLEESIGKDFVETLRKFTEAYYLGLQVKVLPNYGLNQHNIGHRINKGISKLQFNASDILRKLEKNLPKDAYCMIGICLTDLYPQEDWNFVFGLASVKERTGVFSFARYQESFFSKFTTETDHSLLLWRSVKVMVHEIGHMFGMSHCVYYNCGMNGSNNLAESDHRTIMLCPICLRKLHHSIGFNILERYQALKSVCGEFGGRFKKAEEKYEKAIDSITKGKCS